MSDLKVAIISFAHPHAYSYANQFGSITGARLVAIADEDPERLAMLKGRYAGVPAFHGEYREMLDKEQVDAVVICAANADHAPITLDCIARGKHVLCEKPLAIVVEDACAMIRAAREKGVRLMTAFPVRFSKSVHEAKALIKSGALGRLVGASTSNHGSMPGGWFVEPAKSGGGAVMDHTVHVVDLLRWMLEDEVEEVYAEYDRGLHDIPSDDCGQLVLRFGKGTVISLDTSWSRPKSYSVWGDVKMEIKGEKGNLSLNCFPRSVNTYRNETMHHTSSAGVDDMDGLMVREFLAAIRENREPAVSGVDGLRAVEVALAAYRSGEQGKVVRLELAQA